MRLPTATYRLQFNPSFGFEEAREIVPYLADLGISDIYASPVFRARSGSTHGYDVIDPREINPDIGAESEFYDLADYAERHGLGLILDIVPNHMAYSEENPMLSDLLVNGPRSRYSRFFDINWSCPCKKTQDWRLLAPFLSDRYSECLERGEIELKLDFDGFYIGYNQARFPLSIESYADVLMAGGTEIWNEVLRAAPDLAECLEVLSSDCSDDQASEIRRSLWRHYSDPKDPIARELIDRCLDAFRGRAGVPESFDLLDALLSRQNFRLAFWKAAREELNYRRFFTLNEFISLRVEDEEVFSAVHALVLDLVRGGKVKGLRVDHIDGLYDPEQYLARLRHQAKECYIVVEKILSRDEALPASWPVQGTTGYDFMNMAGGLFCREENASEFEKIYRDFTGLSMPFDELVYQKKRLILERQMNGDLDNLAWMLRRLAEKEREGRDATFRGLRSALAEVLSHFPVYRSYGTYRAISASDRARIKHALKKARTRNPGLAFDLDFLERVLLMDLPDQASEEERLKWVEFMMRFQQFTGPLMAKGFEDTVLYLYNRMLSLNNVGGSPERFGTSPDEFHVFCCERALFRPHSMNASSTHDTKRGEDSGARISVLSEMPGLWKDTIERWHRQNLGKKRLVEGEEVPDKNEEYFLYQTLIGSMPFSGYDDNFCERTGQYLIKSLREGKIHSKWSEPDTPYEDALISFIKEILRPSDENGFLEDLVRFSSQILKYGIFNSLSQAAIKMTAPGVPDIYQGAELWDLSFVDPDNRRPVDFRERRKALEEISLREKEDLPGLVRELLACREDGKIKLFLIHRVLRARRSMPGLFGMGSYLPMEVVGDRRASCIAFARVNEGLWALTVVPRFLAELIGRDGLPLGRDVWGETRAILPPGAPRIWNDVITESTVEGEHELYLGDILRDYPAAVLIGREGA